MTGGLVLVGGTCVIFGARALRATTAPSVAVNPPAVTEFYYQPTPITITINASGLSGVGLTPAGGYQYGLQWDPAVLRWPSGPGVGAGNGAAVFGPFGPPRSGRPAR